MKRFLAALIVLVAACSGATRSVTAPLPGVDPSVLLTNQSYDTVLVIWGLDTGGFDTVRIAPYAQSVCTRWTQTFDSVYLKLTTVYSAQDSLYGVPAAPTLTEPWLHFAQYPYYFQTDTLIATSNPGMPGQFIQHIAATEC